MFKTLLRLTVATATLAAAGCNGCGGTANDGNTDDTIIVDRVGVTIGSMDARSCDIVLSEIDGVVDIVRFDDSVLGEFDRWAPRVAIAISNRTDAPFSGTVATLELEGDAADPGTTVQIVEQNCYDRLGTPVAAPDVRID